LKRLSASYLARRIDSTGRRPLPARLYQAEAEFSGCSAIRCASGFSNCSKTGPSRCDLLAEIDIEPSSLSQQLAVLRRSGIVTAAPFQRIPATNPPKRAPPRPNGVIKCLTV